MLHGSRMPSSTSGGPTWLAALLVSFTWLVGVGPARAAALQKDAEEVPALDPYTRGEPELLAAVGYVSFGPFAFGDGHDSHEVHRVLGEIPMLWVETEHFRLGSTLAPYTVAEDQDERDKLKRELKRLGQHLPRVKAGTRELDRWLLLHLWAQRLEELYTRFCEQVGVTDADFDSTRAAGAESLGAGRYLGQKGKYTVLLLEKESGLGRYTSHFLQRESRFSLRWNHHRVGSMFFGIAFESMKGSYESDSALHCAVANGLTHNFLDGFRAYTFQAPAWWAHGLAHVLSREVDPRFNVYGGGLGSHGHSEDGWDWEPRVKARVSHEHYPSFDTMLGWADVEAMKDPDHMIAWSRVQFLLEDREATRRFMIALKEPLRPGADERQVLLERQAKAIPECWGADYSELESAWAKWVAKRYRAK